MTTRDFLTMLVAAAFAAAGRAQAPRTDGRQLPRDYASPPPVPVEPAILDSGEVSWEQVEPGMRRKTYVSDRLTMAVIEFTRARPDTAKPVMHYHPHDQVSYVVEGRIRAFIGKQVKELGPGGVYTLPSNVHHGVQVLSSRALLIDVFTPVREDFRKK